MEIQPYYFEIGDQIKMFLNAIDGCVINRYDNTRTAKDKVAVRYIYAPKQRALHDLVNKAQHITLPAVAYWVKNVSFDSKRLFNKIEGSDQSINGTLKHLPQPLPIKIELDVSFLTKYDEDILQIISNLVTYFQPYIVISWNRFGLQYHEIRNKVYWNGSVNIGNPVDINENQPTRFTGDASFTIEGWIFKHDQKASGEIRVIEATFSALSSITNNIEFLLSQVNEDNTDTLTISGMPILMGAYPYNINTQIEYGINIYGSFLRGISAAYLSSNDVYPSLSSTLVDIFSGMPTLSADNPPFYGIPIEFTINNENSIIISIPPALSAGTLDVIFTNRVGYGKLTDDTTSPFASGIKVFDN